MASPILLPLLNWARTLRYPTLFKLAAVLFQRLAGVDDVVLFAAFLGDPDGAVAGAHARAGGVVQGGSSITQQMVKMTLLAQADTDEERAAATDDTYERKLRDLGLLTRDARAVERKKPGRPKARKRFQFSKR